MKMVHDILCINKRREFLRMSKANIMKLKRQEKVKGITLIALVITIVVLLILARSKYSNAYRR